MIIGGFVASESVDGLRSELGIGAAVVDLEPEDGKPTSWPSPRSVDLKHFSRGALRDGFGSRP